MKKTLKMSLCEGYRPVPEAVDGPIFHHNIMDPMDQKALDQTAYDGIWFAAMVHDKKGEWGYIDVDNGKMEYILDPYLSLDLYVNGSPIELITVLNVCRREEIHITIYQYDNGTNSYFKQELL